MYNLIFKNNYEFITTMLICSFDLFILIFFFANDTAEFCKSRTLRKNPIIRHMTCVHKDCVSVESLAVCAKYVYFNDNVQSF